MKRTISKNICKSKIIKKKRFSKFKKSKSKIIELFESIKPNKDALISYFKKCYEETKSTTDNLFTELNILESGSPYMSLYNNNSDFTCTDELKLENLTLFPEYFTDSLQELSCSNNNDDDKDKNKSLDQLLVEEDKINSRIMALKEQNLWFQEIIDKAQIMPRPKFHWDYVIAEMNWLAEDFNREKNWKRICAKKLANAVVKALREKKNKISKDAKQETFKMRKSCASIAKMIKDFWKQMEKIVLAKQQFRLNAKHQEAMTTHLGKVIETTEKYTEWLTEDLKCNSFNEQVDIVKDPDFIVKNDELEESDFEETIEIDEKELADVNDINKELEELQTEGQMDISDLIASLPEEYLSNLLSNNEFSNSLKDGGINSIINFESHSIQIDDMALDCIGSEIIIDQNDFETFKCNLSENDSVNELKSKTISNELAEYMEEGDADEDITNSDEDFDESDVSENDETLIEQENFEMQTVIEYKGEIDELKNEADLPLEELLKRYRLKDEEVLEDSISDSDSSSICSESSSSKESSSDSIESISSMHSKSSDGLNKLFLLDEIKNPESNKFQFPGEIEALTEVALSTQPKGFTIESADVKVNVPHLIRHTLREYQCVGLDWLAAIYEKRLNGILADEMGLGKTIQTIALLSYLACDKAIWGPHLIIVPTSVILNWEIEFKKWSPGFKILTYYGSMKERREKRKGWTKTNAFHVCITSYKLAIQDSLSFKRKKWKYLILDEAQNIKNFKSQRWQTLLTFNSQRRLLLTGTPLQNNLMELWSLMHFLMPNIFQSHKEFQEWFGSPLTGMIEGNAEYNEQLVRRLHKLLRPFILRRLKKDVEKQMPKKYEHIIMCKLSKRQRFLYDDFMSLTSTQETLAGGQFLSVINILMQLRKVCNHPNLFETRPTISPFLIIDEFCLNAPRQIFVCDHFATPNSTLPFGTPGLADMALNLPKFVSERILQLLPHTNLIEEVDSISVSDWVTKNKTLHGPSSWKNGRPFLTRNIGFSNIPDETYRQLNEENDIHFITKSADRENLGMQIIKEQKPGMNNESLLPEYIVNSRIQIRQDSLKLMAQRNINRCNLSITFGPDVVKFLTIKKFKSVNDSILLELPLITGNSLHKIYLDTDDILKRFVFCVPPALSNSVRVNKSCLMREKEIKFTNLFFSHVKPLIPDGHYKVVNLQRVQFPDTRLIQYDCGKLQTLEILLKRLHKESHRCLIFTQMTRMLDILEQFLSYLGYRYLRLDGTTKVEQRQLLMESFNQDSRIFVFILSTRSGGLGVNLTGADTVIFYDSDWNPTMDAQAQDRCHRIGQTRDVHIYRLISQMTVEENILKKANQKRTLNDMAIEGGQFNTAFFKTNTLQDLFKAPSGLEDLIQDQTSSENESNNTKLEIRETKDIKTEFKITTRSGRQIKWRGPPISTQSPEKILSRGTNENTFCQENSIDTTEFEEALLQIEDENDRIAASNAKAEMKADLAEFDETIPWEEIENSNDQQTIISKAEEYEKEEKFHLETERQIKEFEEQLNPIQRFGVRVVESVIEDTLADQLELAEQNLESSKKAWHLEQLKALHEADEMKAEIEEDDMLYCYGNYDPTTQKKELERLKKEEAEFFKAEKRKIEEKAKQAKVDAARRAWSRQQHFLAIKRKHLQTNNRFNKISRTIKHNRAITNLEYPQTSVDIDNNGQSGPNRLNDEASSCKTLKSNHFPSHKTNTARQFFPKVRFNNNTQAYYHNSRSQVNNRFPTFHLAPRPNVINIQNPQNNISAFGKSSNQIQSNSLSHNQSQTIHQSVPQNVPLNSINKGFPKPVTSYPPRIIHSNSINNSNCNSINNAVNIINSTNQCTNSNSIQIKSSNISNGYSTNSHSSFQIPIQSLCNFRTSIPGQQLIINSQPVLLINRQISPQNHSIIARPQSSTPVMQIINRPSNINIQAQQPRFANSSIITERPPNSRFNNMISLPNNQSFILPSVSGTNANIIRINCNTSNNYISKPDFIAPNIVSLNNYSNSVLRLAAVTNNISSINGSYQTIASNPMIILNNNNNINQNNKTIFSTSLPISISSSNNKPITVSPLINSNTMSTSRANNPSL